MRPWIAVIAVLGVLAAGCGRPEARPLGSFTPQAAVAGGEFERVGAVTQEEVSPARPIGVGPAETPKRPEPVAAPAPLTRPDHEMPYQARLDRVALPVPERVPLAVYEEDGSGLRLVNAVLATVNDEVITREDILGPLRPQLRQWREELSQEAFESRCRYLVHLKLREAISERLVLQEAKRRLSEAETKQIEVTLGQILKDLTAEAGSLLLLEERLRLEGTTVKQEMERQRQRLIVQRFLRERIAPSIYVTHSELLAHYNGLRRERYEKPTRVHLRLIAIRKSDFPEPDQARAHAEAVHGRARSGEDFARLAARYSRDVMAEKGGDWGLVTRGAFRVPEVDEAAFALGPGEVGPLLETADAFYVVKVDARHEAGLVPFTEVQDELEAEILDRKYNETVAKYIQDLYDRSYVRMMTGNL